MVLQVKGNFSWDVARVYGLVTRRIGLDGRRLCVLAPLPGQSPRRPPLCRDRMSVPRGPCTLPIMREAWVHGVIDQNTLVWGQGLADWLPIRNVKTLVPQIRTVEGGLCERG